MLDMDFTHLDSKDTCNTKYEYDAIYVDDLLIVRRRRSNPGGHTDGLVMFACSSDAGEGQSS